MNRHPTFVTVENSLHQIQDICYGKNSHHQTLDICYGRDSHYDKTAEHLLDIFRHWWFILKINVKDMLTEGSEWDTLLYFHPPPTQKCKKKTKPTKNLKNFFVCIQLAGCEAVCIWSVHCVCLLGGTVCNPSSLYMGRVSTLNNLVVARMTLTTIEQG